MNYFAKRSFNSRIVDAAGSAAFAVALLSINGFAHASASSDEQSLAKGAIEDVTPQQKYRTAIREAGGGYKEWLRECVHMPVAESRTCRLEAKATYDREMAQAQLILRGRESTRPRS